MSANQKGLTRVAIAFIKNNRTHFLHERTFNLNLHEIRTNHQGYLD